MRGGFGCSAVVRAIPIRRVEQEIRRALVICLSALSSAGIDLTPAGHALASLKKRFGQVVTLLLKSFLAFV
jgi:hypothetical protein